MIHVLIVHEHPLFRVGLRSTLAESAEIDIVGETGERELLLELTAATHPDVVLFDGALTSCQPASRAMEMVAHLRTAGARGIIVFAPRADEELLFQYMKHGAAAYELPTITWRGTGGEDTTSSVWRLCDEQCCALVCFSKAISARDAPCSLHTRELASSEQSEKGDRPRDHDFAEDHARRQ